MAPAPARGIETRARRLHDPEELAHARAVEALLQRLGRELLGEARVEHGREGDRRVGQDALGGDGDAEEVVDREADLLVLLAARDRGDRLGLARHDEAARHARAVVLVDARRPLDDRRGHRDRGRAPGDGVGLGRRAHERGREAHGQEEVAVGVGVLALLVATGGGEEPEAVVQAPGLGGLEHGQEEVLVGLEAALRVLPPALLHDDGLAVGARGLARARAAVAGERVAVLLQAIGAGAVLGRLRVEGLGLGDEGVEAGGLLLGEPAFLVGERVGFGALGGGLAGGLFGSEGELGHGRASFARGARLAWRPAQCRGEGAAARHSTGHGLDAALSHSATLARGTATERSRAIASRGTARGRSLRVTRDSQPQEGGRNRTSGSRWHVSGPRYRVTREVHSMYGHIGQSSAVTANWGRVVSAGPQRSPGIVRAMRPRRTGAARRHPSCRSPSWRRVDEAPRTASFLEPPADGPFPPRA